MSKVSSGPLAAIRWVERITAPGFRFTGRPGSEGDATGDGSTGRGPVLGSGLARGWAGGYRPEAAVGAS